MSTLSLSNMTIKWTQRADSITIVRLDENRQVIVSIATGRNQIVSVLINLSTEMADAKFDFSSATLLDNFTKGALKHGPPDR